MRILAGKKKAKTFDIKNNYGVDVDDEDMFKKQKILENFKKHC